MAKLLILYGLWRPSLCRPRPPPHLLSIQSPGLISSLTMLSQRGSQLLSSFSFLFPPQAPAALLSRLWCLGLPDDPRLMSCATFVAQLSQVRDREASYCRGKTPKMVSALFLLLSSVGLCGVKEGRLSRESISFLNVTKHFWAVLLNGFFRILQSCGGGIIAKCLNSPFTLHFLNVDISPSHCQKANN